MHRTTGYEPLNVPKPFGPEIWIVDGPHIRFYGMPFSTRMTLVRLPSGRLWIHSPIRPAPGLFETVEALGPVAHLVAPNAIHYASLPDWQRRFPEARTWVAPGVRARAASRKLEIGPAEELARQADWEDVLHGHLVTGSKVLQEMVFFHAPSRCLVLTDFIENFDPAKLPWLMGKLVKLAGISRPDGRMPPDMRATFDKAALRDHVETLLSWQPETAIMAHGEPWRRDASLRLRRAFAGLLDQG
ncbi:DUF4336 domain-containing protein [Oceanicola sp. S124]|uniref:DUF4336 domain-containing protein n=1 Tax=Oceanicola sp. S124 TaxID=1042378 RepID=UPI00025590F7|nr:DUF4336 domain-containing protein [Oceanicola sp. S124]